MSSSHDLIGHVVKVTGGRVRGDCEEGVCRFISVPYAAPPEGENRFKRPASPAPWTGVRDATRPGACAPHLIRAFPAIDVVPLVGTGSLAGGDYLTLNVWAPSVGEK